MLLVLGLHLYYRSVQAAPTARTEAEEQRVEIVMLQEQFVLVPQPGPQALVERSV